jgi:DNA-directed RNA polymerase specialized sigma24 family protein
LPLSKRRLTLNTPPKRVRNDRRKTRHQKKQVAKRLQRHHDTHKRLPQYAPREPEGAILAPPPPEPLPLISDDQLLATYERLIVRVSHVLQNRYHLRDEDAQDLAQAARIRLYRTPQDKRHIPVWLRTVCNNAMRSELTRIRRHKDSTTPLDPAWWAASQDSATESQGTDPIDVLSDVTEPVDTLLERDQLAQSLLDSLSAEQRLVMTLFLGLTPGDRPIKDFRTLSKLAMVRESRLQYVIDASLAKMRRLASTNERAPDRSN